MPAYELRISDWSSDVCSPELCGRNYLESPFNRATLARRQPCSAFKPIVYLTTVEIGIRPDDEFVDGPISIGNWRPRNYDGQYHGTMTMRAAVAHSINKIGRAHV